MGGVVGGVGGVVEAWREGGRKLRGDRQLMAAMAAAAA